MPTIFSYTFVIFTPIETHKIKIKESKIKIGANVMSIHGFTWMQPKTMCKKTSFN